MRKDKIIVISEKTLSYAMNYMFSKGWRECDKIYQEKLTSVNVNLRYRASIRKESYEECLILIGLLSNEETQ